MFTSFLSRNLSLAPLRPVPFCKIEDQDLSLRLKTGLSVRESFSLTDCVTSSTCDTAVVLLKLHTHPEVKSAPCSFSSPPPSFPQKQPIRFRVVTVQKWRARVVTKLIFQNGGSLCKTIFRLCRLFAFFYAKGSGE